jgi:hypothetical protein
VGARVRALDPTAPSESTEVPLIVGYNHTESLMMLQSQMALDLDERGLRERALNLPGGARPDAVDRLLMAYR